MFYAISTSPDTVIVYRWSTELPTQEGWYWCKNTRYTLSPVAVFHVVNSHDGLRIAFDDKSLLLSEQNFITHWLGVIPVPDLPDL